MNPVIKIENLTFSYKDLPVLTDINFSVEEKDFVGVIGPNGGGKTTLFKLILGLFKPVSGNISVFGKTPAKAASLIGYVPQYGEMDKNFPIRTKEVVEMGVVDKTFILSRSLKKKSDLVYGSLESVGLADLANRTFGELSGGQQQRCLIARALASKPKILLLDEPTTSVDITVEEDIYELLKKLNKEITILLASHDLGFISTYINKIACVNRELAWHKTDEISAAKIINDAYHNNIAVIKHKCKL